MGASRKSVVRNPARSPQILKIHWCSFPAYVENVASKGPSSVDVGEVATSQRQGRGRTAPGLGQIGLFSVFFLSKSYSTQSFRRTSPTSAGRVNSKTPKGRMHSAPTCPLRVLPQDSEEQSDLTREVDRAIRNAISFLELGAPGVHKETRTHFRSDPSHRRPPRQWRNRCQY